MHVRRPVILGAVLACLAAPAFAQESLPARSFQHAVPLIRAESPSQQLTEVERWRHDYEAWKTWFLRWRNTSEPGVWHARQRRQPPVPPAWLPEMCAALQEDAGPLAEGCHDWEEFESGDEGAGLLTQQTAQARSQLETPKHTAWWEHVHVDGLWPMTQTGTGAFGLAGMHTTMNVSGRFQVFLVPGVIIMSAPSVAGNMTWSAATDWGFSYRLFDFVMPGTRRASALHFNMVRVWMLGANTMRMPGEMYLAGFSVTFKKR